jgi:hypothetical protein
VLEQLVLVVVPEARVTRKHRELLVKQELLVYHKFLEQLLVLVHLVNQAHLMFFPELMENLELPEETVVVEILHCLERHQHPVHRLHQEPPLLLELMAQQVQQVRQVSLVLLIQVVHRDLVPLQLVLRLLLIHQTTPGINQLVLPL